MPPEPIAFDSSDSDVNYEASVRSSKRLARKRAPRETSYRLISGDDSGHDDHVQYQRRPRRSHEPIELGNADGIKKTKKRKRTEEEKRLRKEEKRQSRRKEREAKADASPSQPRTTLRIKEPTETIAASRDPPTETEAPAKVRSTSTPASASASASVSVPAAAAAGSSAQAPLVLSSSLSSPPHQIASSEDDDLPLPSLVVGKSKSASPATQHSPSGQATNRPSKPPSRSPPRTISEHITIPPTSDAANVDDAIRSEDELAMDSALAPLSSDNSLWNGRSEVRTAANPPTTSLEPDVSSSLTTIDEVDDGVAAVPMDEDDLDAEGDVSDVSSITYSEDSEPEEEGKYFYTSSEGSLHGSDSEEGLGSWDEKDQRKWQGSTAHLDEAYDGNYHIQAVLRHRRNPRRGFVEYRTVWSGYPIYSTTWEQESHFNSPRTMREYWERKGGRPADLPVDDNAYSTHDSDTDIAVNRRPRKRAHQALRKRRREIRRDKLELREYLKSLDDQRRSKIKEEERKFENFRIANHLTLDTERHREKGLSKSHQKRQEKILRKKWSRSGGNTSAAAGSSRYPITNANRVLPDVSMKAKSTANSMARTRVSQLDDGFPDNDDNQIVFRRSAPTNNPTFTGSIQPIQPPSASSSQAIRPPPGSFKGAHKREGKVKVVNPGFNDFLSKVHRPSATQAPAPTAAGPSGASYGTARPSAMPRRPSEPKKSSNLLVLKPLEDFTDRSVSKVGGNMNAAGHSSSSSEAGEVDFGIPEMSAYRTTYNPHQPASEAQPRPGRPAPASIQAASQQRPPPRQVHFSQQRPSTQDPRQVTEDPRRQMFMSTTEDPRRRPGSAASPLGAGGQDHLMKSPLADSGSEFQMVGASMSPSDSFATMASPVHNASPVHPQASSSKPVQMKWKGWINFCIGQGEIVPGLEAALFAPDTYSASRIEELGLKDKLDPLDFDLVYPFAWLREIFGQEMKQAEHSKRAYDPEAMQLYAHGPNATDGQITLEYISNDLHRSDMALLASTPMHPSKATSDSESDSPTLEYLVVFSNKYDIDPISGIPSSLKSLQRRTNSLYVVPVKLRYPPASARLSDLPQMPQLPPNIISLFDSAVGKKVHEKDNLRINDFRRSKYAARRYGLNASMHETIKSGYNLIFAGKDSMSYEKTVMYVMVRVLEGGVRMFLDGPDNSKLYTDPKLHVNVFIPRSAMAEALERTEHRPTFALSEYLRRLKRQPRCKFWSYGFSSEDPDERFRETFPGQKGIVTMSMSAVLTDLLRSSLPPENAEKEEGQLTQQSQGEDQAARSVFCTVAEHLPSGWRIFLHPWVKSCIKLLGDHLEEACRSLKLLSDEQEFPAELIFDLDAKLDSIYSVVGVDEFSPDSTFRPPFEEPSEVPDQAEDLVRSIDEEVFLTLRKYQLHSAYMARFHVLVTSEIDAERSEVELAGLERMMISEFEDDACRRLATLPGNT